MNNNLSCKHNKRSRYTNGFYCGDCNNFFDMNSPVYRQSELLSSIWMVLHNINASSLQAGKGEITDALKMRDKIDVGIKHANYEELIEEAEVIMKKYGKNSKSASIQM